ncbi:MAG: indolepyruvate ferredoxin oxidoreductase subunit alpha [Treponema sp.]|nr:indolepyruvate ferredoxin oxidoreductase subunit alpha [Treponema sp.]
MKQLLLGNAAVARGLYEAGVSIVSSYPGTPSTEITEEAARFKEIYCEWAPNEKVAVETAYGASLAGARSFAAMKHVGLNVAADPLFTLSYTGVNGGLVIGVADDPGMHSSQNEQDSRHYAIASKIPMVDPSDSQEAIDFVKEAYEISEKFDTPVLLKMCTRIAHSQSVVETGERKEVPLKNYEKNIQKNVMTPANAIRKHPIVEDRTIRLTEYAETCSLNRVEMGKTDIGIITSSTSYQYAKEVFGDDASFLKIGLVNPLPVKLIKDFASKVKTVYIIEELDPIIENHCKAMGIEVHGKDTMPLCGEFSQNIIRKAFNMPVSEGKKPDSAIPVRPPVMCAGCPHRGMFYVLSKNKITVIGDIGCYTLGAAAPLNAMDCNLCMGASVSGLHGFNKARGKDSENRTVGIIGDSTFCHSGITGLASIAYNQSNSTVIIVDNSITGMTGHQNNPANGMNLYGDPTSSINLEALCQAVGIAKEHIRVVDPYMLDETEKVLKEELAFEGPSVIISRRPCALLKTVKHQPPLKINEDKCVGCKMCMKIGCPALSVKNKKAVIDPTMCVGCEVCTQMCKMGAIEK